VLEARNLSKRFGKALAVDDVSFRVEPGTVTGFLGPNGAGKTTTLRMLLGLVDPTAGEATIDGRRYRELDEPVRRVGAVLEASGFHPGRSGRNHLRLVASGGRVPASRADEVLALVDLQAQARRRVKTYSLGMRQRLALAAALIGDPEILILDEPANGLDPQGIRWLRDLLRSLADEGRTVFVSSHVLAEIGQIADSVIILDHGRLVAQAPLDDVLARSSAGVRIRTPQAALLRDRLVASGVEVAPLADGALLARGTSSDRVGELAAQNGVVLHELTAEGSTLEEVFLALTSGARDAS